ncbi:vanadium-dependent haloperoxidase [Vibrio sp. ZSDE26]|uniref:Vanadium-dependent haloperoxidase n=1 Tax=Vibrio amylolyticus TaxID=2847292 RepID=A0A9X1XEX3_9VIBR|nr:vanadium-dependent haloperoxidase [Vibrio amylolyticus]MCK6261752.1 vanadium-dependent haloperoxidase [Vibrio amylolyticus]
MFLLKRMPLKLIAGLSLLFSFNGLAIDLKNGNAAAEVVIPSAIGAIFEASPSGGDATLVLRATTLLTNAWFDASAPYHPTAVGVYSTIERRPANENEDNENINIALLYASQHILKSLYPHRSSEWEAMLSNLGLDPHNASTDIISPIGIGNVAGQAIVEVREHDGMNQLGDEGGKVHNRMPYQDYLGYKPKNTAYRLINPSAWQPAILSTGHGLYRVQQFVTPQHRKTLPYTYDSVHAFRSPRPSASKVYNWSAYVEQADQVLQESANLDDHKKMYAEFFDDKIFSLGFSALYASQVNNLSLIEFIHYDFLTNVAAFDTSIAIWKEKYKHDAVRPFSAIAFIYRDNPVTAWGGIGQGTVTDIPASQWTSYLNVADHPEYPSASASFCAAHAQTSRLYLGSDELGYVVPVNQGSSKVEPDITPSQPIELEFETWTDLEDKCGQSRVWAGVHFPASVPAGQDIGREIGQIAYEFVMAKINPSGAN